MSTQTQKVALPAYLPKRLQAFRIGGGSNESYLLRDKLQNKTFDFEPWQFFILEVLPGCDDFDKLASVFEDRFGYPLKQDQAGDLFAQLADNRLLDENTGHPLLQPYTKRHYTTEDGVAKVKSFRTPAPQAQAEAPAAPADATDGDLPPGIQDAFGFDPKVTRRLWTLFDPRPVLGILSSAAAPLRFGVYLLPLLALSAVILSIQNGHLVQEDMTRLLGGTSFLGHVLFSMFTVNLLVTLTTAIVAYRYRATVNAFGIAVYFGFFPRFAVRVGHAQQLSRRERLWLHAAPLLMRLSLLSIGVLVWYNSRAMNGLSAQLGLGLALICTIALLFSANPLVKGSGYHLLSAFLNEPHLRGKSFKALYGRLRGNSFKESENGVLASYALASFVYMFVVMTAAILVFGAWLKQLHLGGTAIILLSVLGIFLLRKTIRRARRIEAAYERSVQFERWRKRSLPPEPVNEVGETQAAGGFSGFVKYSALATVLVVALLPYPYEAGGSFTIIPSQRQDVATDIAGIVDEVYFDGGETLTKGTVIARLAHDDYQAQLNVYSAKIQEQIAVIQDLKMRPKPEEIDLAQRALKIARTQVLYSREKLTRTENLYKTNAVSLEELAKQQREYQVDVDQVAEKQAALDLVKSGSTREQIAAAEARLESLHAERDAFTNMIDRSALRMPFDGTILTLHLKQKVNSYLGKGEVFAAVENSGQVLAEIDVPESDIGYVTQSAAVRVRPVAYNGEIFMGGVTQVDRNITVKPYGNVIKVVALIDNHDGKLMTGMTGYAKIESGSMPVWKAFSQAIFRFAQVHMWSWIP
jgi:putative peptide zinc metalloprotease protein